MTSSKAVSRRFLALGVLVGALATAGVLAMAAALDPPDAGTEDAPAEEDHAGAMDADWRCQHMPEHCADANASRGGGTPWA